MNDHDSIIDRDDLILSAGDNGSPSQVVKVQNSSSESHIVQSVSGENHEIEIPPVRPKRQATDVCKQNLRRWCAQLNQ